MVVFVDLDDPDEVEQQHQHQHHGLRPFDMRDLMNAHTLSSHQTPEIQEQEQEDDDEEGHDHPNLNALSAVLGNYPFVTSPQTPLALPIQKKHC